MKEQELKIKLASPIQESVLVGDGHYDTKLGINTLERLKSDLLTMQTKNSKIIDSFNATGGRIFKNAIGDLEFSHGKVCLILTKSSIKDINYDDLESVMNMISASFDAPVIEGAIKDIDEKIKHEEAMKTHEGITSISKNIRNDLWATLNAINGMEVNEL